MMEIRGLISLIEMAQGRWLYHGTLASNLPSIAQHSLSSDFGKVRAGCIHLAADSMHAGNYRNNWGDGEGVVLAVNTASLDQGKLGPDREDLMDILDQMDDDREWSDVEWEESLDLSGQCTYEGVIPPQALRVVGRRGGLRRL